MLFSSECQLVADPLRARDSDLAGESGMLLELSNHPLHPTPQTAMMPAMIPLLAALYLLFVYLLLMLARRVGRAVSQSSGGIRQASH